MSEEPPPERGADGADGAASLEWSEAAAATLAQLVAMVPETFRSLAEAATREESEVLASERGDEAVEATDVVRGWIRTTPPEQRDALVPVIEDLGFDPVDFAEDLQSAEGWSGEDPSAGR